MIILVLSLFSGVILAVLSTTAVIEDRSEWWQICWWLALGSTLLSGAVALVDAGAFLSPVLLRDAAASLLLAPVLPLAYGGLLRVAHRLFANRAVNVVIGTAAALGGTALSFFVIFSIHCTSGDCP